MAISNVSPFWGAFSTSASSFSVSAYRLVGETGKLFQQIFFKARAEAELFLLRGGFGQILFIGGGGRKNIFFDHVEHGERFNVDLLVVILKLNVVTGIDFRLGQDAVLFEQVDVFFLDVIRHGFHGAAQVQQTALFRFRNPLRRIVVAVEDNALMVVDGILDDLVERGLEILRLFQLVGKLLEFVGDDGVQHHVRAGEGSGGTDACGTRTCCR